MENAPAVDMPNQFIGNRGLKNSTHQLVMEANEKTRVATKSTPIVRVPTGEVKLSNSNAIQSIETSNVTRKISHSFLLALSWVGDM
jgi:hypothetical protein